jgi:hypothetical protein
VWLVAFVIVELISVYKDSMNIFVVKRSLLVGISLVCDIRICGHWPFNTISDHTSCVNHQRNLVNLPEKNAMETNN